MGSSKRSRKYSVAMCLVFNKTYLFAVFLTVALARPPLAFAETGVVSAVGVGRDTPDAIANLLKVTSGKYFKEYSASLVKSVLQTEILPNASSFVQSYRILDGGRSGSLQLSANVDLDVINGLLSLTPKSLGEEGEVKALVAVRAPKLPDSSIAGMKPLPSNSKLADPFAALTSGARERLLRRDFRDVVLSHEELQVVGAGEDFSSPELLRGLGAKAGARIALGVSGKYETYENENSHNRDERLVLIATLLDVKTGNVLGRASVNVANPRSRREQYLADLQRSVQEESKDLFQDVFVSAGRRLVKKEGQASYSLVRIQFASNNSLVLKFKAMLEAVPGIRSVFEHSITRGQFDLAIRPVISRENLKKTVLGMQNPEIQVTVLDDDSGADQVSASLVVKVSPKEMPEDNSEGVPNAKH